SVIPPRASAHASVCPGPESAEAVRPSVAGGTDTGAVMFGAGKGQSKTVVCTSAVLLSETGSTRAPETSELLVSVPATEGVPTIWTVAVAPRARSPRSQCAPNVSSVQDPWLGVAESTLALMVRPSETSTATAGPGPLLVTVSVYVTDAPGTVGSGESVCVIARSALNAERASTRPHPNVLLGTWSPGTSPQVSLIVRGAAVAVRLFSIESGSPIKSGLPERRSATTPTTWGPAVLVPLKDAYPPPGTRDRTLTPGAEMSGFMRPLPSIVTGPRLEKPAMSSLMSVAPTEKDAS